MEKLRAIFQLGEDSGARSGSWLTTNITIAHMDSVDRTCCV